MTNMAKHTKKRSPILPDWRLSSLPRLLKGGKKRRSRLRYARELTTADLIETASAAVLFVLALILPLPQWASKLILGLSALCAGFSLLRRAATEALAGKLPLEDLYLILAGVIAFLLGHDRGAAISLILCRFLQIAQAYAQRRSEAALDLIRDRLPGNCLLETSDGTEKVMPEQVLPGDVLLVEAGESLALDGVVLEGISEVDPSGLTGDSASLSVTAGDEVLAGYRNLSGPLRVRVTRLFEDSAAARLLLGVDKASKKRTTYAILADRVSRIWRVACGLVALAAALLLPLTGIGWIESLRRAAVVLLLASPSSLVISMALSYLGATLSALRQGILFKTNQCFERLTRTSKMVFGKTGTITEGKYSVAEIFPANGVTESQLLSVAAAAESHSHHPIAQCLRRAGGWTPELAETVMEVQEVPGKGVTAFIEGRCVYVGNAALLEEHHIWYATPSRPGAAVHVAVEDRYWGHIMLTDKIRDGAYDALEALRSLGVGALVMLTGDVWSVSRPLALAINFDWVKAELSPEGKLAAIDALRKGLGDRQYIAYVGDGIHDAPMMQKADLGIAIHALETWAESEDADIAILEDEIHMLPAAMSIAAGVQKIALINLLAYGGLKLLMLLLALQGSLPVTAAALLDTVGGIGVLYNALRAFDLE